MTKSTREDGIGQPVIRKEDAALVTGQGRFSDDLDLVGQAYAVMVRSPHAHARIRAIDAAAALALPGVVAVLTGADALADGLKPIPHRPLIGPPDIALGKPDTSDKFLWPHRVLPHDKARFVGEAVAMVVAETRQRREGRRRARARRLRAAARGDRHGGGGRGARAAALGRRRLERLHRRAGRRRRGDRGGVRARGACGEARHLGAARHRRADRAARRGRQLRRGDRPLHAPRRQRRRGAAEARARRRSRRARGRSVRVVSGDVGGNFGTRNAFYPEFALVAWAARAHRPPGQVDLRASARPSSATTRAATWRSSAELALDDDGRIPGDARRVICNIGAHSVIVRAAGQGRPSCSPPSTACRSRTSAPAPCSATRRRPTRIAAPAGPRRCS